MLRTWRRFQLNCLKCGKKGLLLIRNSAGSNDHAVENFKALMLDREHPDKSEWECLSCASHDVGLAHMLSHAIQ